MLGLSFEQFYFSHKDQPTTKTTKASLFQKPKPFKPCACAEKLLLAIHKRYDVFFWEVTKLLVDLFLHSYYIAFLERKKQVIGSEFDRSFEGLEVVRFRA